MPSLSASPSSPWTAAQLTAARTNGTSHSWQLPGVPGVFGVQVELDETSRPYGRCRFSLPEVNLPATLNGVSNMQAWDLQAGYSGTLARLFAGWPTKVTSRGDGTATVELDTGESLYDDFPLADLGYVIPADASTITDLNNALSGLITGWRPATWQDPALTAPTTAQLTAFRNYTFGGGDSLGDAFRTAASALGQKVHGDHLLRGQAGLTVPVLAVRPQWTYAAGSALTIGPGEWIEWERTSSPDAYATATKITAVWTESGADKSSSYTYTAAGKTQAAGDRLCYRELSVQLRPETSGGTRKLTASNPIAKAYAATNLRRTWQTTITTRAWWWLEPGASLTVVGPDGQTDNGIVSRVVHDVDAGLTTITIRPS